MSDRERSTHPMHGPSHEDGGEFDPAEAIAAIYGPGAPLGDPTPGPEAEPEPEPPAADPHARVAGAEPPAARGGRRGRRGRPQLVAIEGGGGEPPDEAPRPRAKIKWIRLLALLSGLGVLAVISTVFGMMMAVASDLPEIDVLDVASRQSRITDRDGKDLGVLTGNQNRILVRSNEIAPVMKHAIVAIEDQRFYTNNGVDLRSIGRALWQDIVRRRAAQGGSTIAQQLVKNRLEAQDNRTVFQKLREAAMAFHMTRKWDKDRILRNYLNTIYFGNGAYGIESAARTYFGSEYGLGTQSAQCGSSPGQRRCASLLEPAQAALIAAVVSSPSLYDPVTRPRAAQEQRNLVLLRMRQQGYLAPDQYQRALAEPLPTRNDVRPPQETSKYPYFTTWVRQQIVDQVGAGKAFEGGLEVRTTIDADLQQAAEAAITQWLGPKPGFNGTPAAALVAIDNRSSEVLAMVGGAPDSYNERPFNLATQGQRQPGSSFKPFILAEALQHGYGPASTFTSVKKDFCVTKRKGRCVEHFVVNNYDDAYAGLTNLANATAFSDNSVFAELGLKLGTAKIARLARRLGVRSPVSSNYAMTLGGLKQGVTVMDMAHAYESFASGGKLVYGSLSPGAAAYEDRGEKGTVPGPVGIRAILEPRGGKLRPAELRDGERAINRRRTTRVLPESTASAVQTMLQGVVRIGSGKRASLGPDIMVAGKTGTTENYGDAWFVGWTPRYTVAVWVGFPDELKPMEPPTFSFNGEPVAGGTYPAAIWGTFMRQAMAIYEGRNPGSAEELQPDAAPTPGATAPQGSADGAPVPTAPPSETPPPSTQQNPATTAPEQPTPAPTQAPPSGGGTGGGGTGGGGTGGAPSTGAGGATPPEPGADAATGQSTD